MENLESLFLETSSFKAFLESGVKKMNEDDYYRLCNKCITEIDEEKPDHSKMGFFGNMAWFTPRQRAFRTLIEKFNIQIKWNNEFEDRLREYLEQEGPGPDTPFAKLDWYSQKRKELEEIMAREDEDVGC